MGDGFGRKDNAALYLDGWSWVRWSLQVRPPNAIPARRCDGALRIVSRHQSIYPYPAGPEEPVPDRVLANRVWTVRRRPGRVWATLRTVLLDMAATAWQDRDAATATLKCRRAAICGYGWDRRDIETG